MSDYQKRLLYRLTIVRSFTISRPARILPVDFLFISPIPVPPSHSYVFYLFWTPALRPKMCSASRKSFRIEP